MRRLHGLLVLWLWMPWAGAGEVITSTVIHEGREYTMDVDGLVDVPFERVYRIVTDYDNLERLNPALEEATLLPAVIPGTQRRRLVTRACVLLFCFRAKVVEDVRESERGIIDTVIDPVESDFHSGKTRWEVTDNGDGRTRIHFTCRLEPSFFVPPLLGPWIMKRKMLNQALATYTRIEMLAADD